MKKIYCLTFALFFAVLACKAKQKPSGGNSVGDAPPSIPVGKEEDKLYRDIYTNLSTYITSDNNFSPEEVVKGGFDKLKNKVLIYQDKNSSKWVALGVANNGQNVFVGIGGPNDVASAVAEASKGENWDPRKLFFSVNGGNVRLSWAARIGKPNSTTFEKFTGFNATDNGIPQGFGADYTLVDDYEQIFFDKKGWWEGLSQAEKNTHKNGRNANYVMEKNGVSVGSTAAKRKAWLWDFWSGNTYEWWGGTVNVRLAKPENIRFGYADEAGDYYPGGVGSKQYKLTKVSDTNSSDKQYDTISPNGKTIFTRSIDHTGTWNYAGNQAVFLATVVGYNVRMKTVTPKDFKNDDVFNFDGTDWNLDTPFDIVLMEFDVSAYEDARYDKWDDTMDAPQTGTPNNTLLPGSDIGDDKTGGNKSSYSRVYFIVRK